VSHIIHTVTPLISHLVNHKFNEYIIDGKIDKETDPSQRKKILMQTQPVWIISHVIPSSAYAFIQIFCYACPRASQHDDLSLFTEHIIQAHLRTRSKFNRGDTNKKV